MTVAQPAARKPLLSGPRSGILPTRLAIGLALVSFGCSHDATDPAREVVTPGRLEPGSFPVAATAGATILPPPVVTLRDTRERLLPGAVVTFEVVAGGGTIERTTAVTGPDGTATPGAWTLGKHPGANILEARSVGVATVSFSVSASVGPPASLSASQPGTLRGVVGQLLEPTPGVVVQDTFGNPIAGAIVLFATGNGSGQVAPASVPTDADGVARAAWTLGTTPGTHTLQAVLGRLSVSLSAQAVAGAPALLQVLAGNAQTATVAQAVSVAPAVQVRDAFGNAVPGALVQFAVTEGAGAVTGATAASDSSGIARVTRWTMGTRTGPNRLTASLPGVQPVMFSATATPAAPAVLAKVSGDGQAGVAGALVAIVPAVSVSDTFGNPVPNVQVTFTTTAGSVTGGLVLSDAEGVARVGGWRLGPVAGTQTLEARTGALSATFTANALPGSAAVLEIVAGQDQTVQVASAVPVRPAVRVRDAGGNAVPGVAVNFAVLYGGGVVSGASGLSDADGIATVGGWTLGTVAGANRLTASVSGLNPAVFHATGLAGAAAKLVKLAGDMQSATAGTAVSIQPTVRVIDAYGNPVRDAWVTFTASGGASVTGATQTTSATGVAMVGSWVLATVPGVNTLTASASGTGAVTFTATGLDYVPTPPPFHIKLRFLTAVTSTQRQAFDLAADRWEKVLTADLPDVWLTLPSSACTEGSPALNELVDDLMILVWLQPIDGAGSILGSAGPCYVRDDGSLPLLGLMRFDTADLDALELSGRLRDVILHEMGHVLGIGTLWNSFGLLRGGGTDDPFFSGTEARQSFILAGGSAPAGYGVPVENTGGSGTRDSHWRESVLRNELMTGWISSSSNPLSAISIASLRDLGYAVDLTKADAFSLSAAGYEFAATPPMLLQEEPLPPPRIAR